EARAVVRMPPPRAAMVPAVEAAARPAAVQEVLAYRGVERGWMLVWAEALVLAGKVGAVLDAVSVVRAAVGADTAGMAAGTSSVLPLGVIEIRGDP
ncbi:MAG: hypothetical protein ACM359_10775, partial [Bacillota bacterium]